MSALRKLACLLLIATAINAQGFLNLIKENIEIRNNVRPEVNERQTYDFIVVGAGTGGSVVANRLSENGRWRVLLLEAGEPPGVLNMIPAITPFFALTRYNWGYRVQPQRNACFGMRNHQCEWPRGKALGGSSTLNYMIYSRGNAKDYDLWAKMGNTGWSYKEVLQYYKKSEKFSGPGKADPGYHGHYGYTSVEYVPYSTPLAKAFVEAGNQLGYKTVDYNGKNQIGFSLLQATSDRGSRCSAARAYLRVNRSNLDVVTGAHVTRVLIDKNKRAVGVEYIRRNQLKKVYSTKEVILSAGSIDSAKLLMLSGIGPKEHLQSLGIGVFKDAKVGYNLYEHIGFLGLIFLVNTPTSLLKRRVATPRNLMEYLLRRTGPITTIGGAEAIAFLKTRYAIDDRPDVELLFTGSSFHTDNGLVFRRSVGITDEMYNAYYKPLEGRDAWSIWPIVQHPQSVGRVTLRSKNPLDTPILEPNFFSDPADLEIILEGLKLAINVSKTPAFQAHGSTLYTNKVPGCARFHFGSDDYWRCAIRYLPSIMDHQIGTVKMGPWSDPNAVVDPELKVYGIDRLRVVDASIMPSMVNGHINAGIFMIGEKGADMIKATWGNH